MTLNDRSLRQWEADTHILLTEEQRTVILDTLGSEPDDGLEWSAQDISETVRKICRDYPAPQKQMPDFLR